MGYTILEFKQTPNPDALKCVVDPKVAALPGPKRVRAYRSPGEAAADPLAAILFAVPGVSSVLIHEEWITVNKDGGVAWSAVKPGIQKALREAP